MIIEVKPSSKWDPDWWDLGKDAPSEEGKARGINEKTFFTPLSQLHFYMAHSGVKFAGPIYGVLLTDRYLVPVKREGSHWGELKIAPAIPWSTCVKDGEMISKLTVQSALWYLSMLASMPHWHYRGEKITRVVDYKEKKIRVKWQEQED